MYLRRKREKEKKNSGKRIKETFKKREVKFFNSNEK
jgi:hypothetical protein